MKRTCFICNKEFKPDSWQVKNRAAKYCSLVCRGIGRKTGEYRKCMICSKSFYVIPAQLKRRPTNGRYCSKICMYKDKTRYENITGRNHYNWKGGVTTTNRLARDKFNKTTRPKVYKRDDYTCQLCGKRGIELQVDHILPWSKYPDLRFDIDNCRTLCVPRHYKITFGKPMPLETKVWGGHYNVI